MKRALVLLCALGATAVPGTAHAWESACHQYADPNAQPWALSAPTPCAPAAGPNTVRHRWVGPLDEHRQLWEETRARAGLPEALSHNASVEVFTPAAEITSGEATFPTLIPAPFDAAERTRVRTFTIGEFAQLPDFSYALWDWALGNETCPLGAVGANATECHDFATHMGPVNSNHFLPQAASFYARYHQLALARAAACGQMAAAVGAGNRERFAPYLRACEVEALTLEAVGQHYLQDAWSSGHMWQRWGAPDLSGFEGQNAADQRERAVLVALVSGLIHGSRGVLQKLPAWTSFDVNDAMCAPHSQVRFVTADGQIGTGVGDDYLDVLSSQTLQSERFFSCAASGMLEVYEATGRVHGPIGTQSGGWWRTDPLGPSCFGQRVTNEAVLTGMGIQLKVAAQQVQMPLDGTTVSWIVPKVAQSNGGVAVDATLKHRFRFELIRMVSVARVVAKVSPEGTELANGRLGTFLGAQPNGVHVETTSELASYIEPPLPWRKSSFGTGQEVQTVRAEALARTFHRAHADDWCQSVTSADLQSLKARAQDTTLPAEVQQSACGACAELAVRHLRVGNETSWDTGREPLCSLLTSTAPVIYQLGAVSDDATALARTWCGCR